MSKFFIPRRDQTALEKYKAQSKDEKEKMVALASCDQDSCMGLNRYYQVMAGETLKRIYRLSASNKVERIKRKAQFYHELARIIERNERLKDTPLP